MYDYVCNRVSHRTATPPLALTASIMATTLTKADNAPAISLTSFFRTLTFYVKVFALSWLVQAPFCEALLSRPLTANNLTIGGISVSSSTSLSLNSSRVLSLPLELGACVPRYVFINVANSVINLAEVEAYDTTGNYIEPLSATLSSCYCSSCTQTCNSWGNLNHGWASNVIDGNLNTICHSSNVVNAEEWLEIDLGENIEVSRLVVYNRVDCCSSRINGATISLYSESMQGGTQCYSSAFSADELSYIFVVSLPTPAPTPVTTSSPSALPTLAPTPVPTLPPSSLPTPAPTLVPSLEPSSIPTSAPTTRCYPGQYFISESNLCVSCGAGRFANVSKPPWPNNCTMCKSGTYTSQIASSICNACPVGKLSSEERTGCITCYAGQYTLNKGCVSCENGWYAPQALTGSCLPCGAGSHTRKHERATTCTPCDAGSFSRAHSVNCTLCAAGRFSGSGMSTCESCSAGTAANEPGASGCSSCPAGRFSLAEAQLCELCPKGKASTAKSQTCASCAAGFVSSNEGSAMCTACGAGSYSSTSKSVNCTSCAPGTAQGATGQSGCTSCSPGTYSAAYGDASCSSCSSNSFSNEDATSCTRCLKQYFFFNSSCFLCPSGTVCDVDGASTLSNLFIEPGWWRISDETDEVRRCTHGSLGCRGGLNFSKGYCTDGHQGILCAVCSDGYYFDPKESACLLCDNLPSPGQLWLSSPPLILFSSLSIIFVAFIVSIICNSNRDSVNSQRKRSVWIQERVDSLNDSAGFVLHYFSLLKGGSVKLKALTSFFQIAQNIGVSSFSFLTSTSCFFKILSATNSMLHSVCLAVQL